MHIVLLHGYLLHGTGSNIYVANLAKSWCRLGHSVTAMCQDRDAHRLPFVTEYIGPDETIPAEPPAPGTLRVVVPFINDLLPVYVLDTYAGYRAKTVPTMTESEIRTHIDMTAAALAEVCAGGIDLVFANHALFSPVIANRVCRKSNVPYYVKIHGSALEYVLVPHPKFMDYAVEGLSGAERVIVGTQYTRDRVLQVFSSFRTTLKLDDKLRVVPPGIDPEVFVPAADFAANNTRFLNKVRARIQENCRGRRRRNPPGPAGRTGESFHSALVAASDTYDQQAVDPDLPGRWQPIKENTPVIMYSGKFLAAKGVGELLALAPGILSRIPESRFVFVGFGAYREHLEGIIHAFGTGSFRLADACAGAGGFVEKVDMQHAFRRLSAAELDHIAVTGLLDHESLGELLPMAALCIVPSRMAEAFGMVAVEAMAAGVLPICNYHTGLKDIVDELCEAMPELADLLYFDRDTFFDELPGRIIAALDYLFPRGFGDQNKRRSVGDKLRRFAVDRFSWDHIARILVD